MDATQALRDAENALRDFIASTLTGAIGDDWIEQCGVSAERIQIWQARKAEEARRQVAGVVDERLVYYADFYDLRTILKKHWQHFAGALGEWRRMEVWLSELERLRDPNAHRRELLPHQVHLAIGISGEIRSRLVRYRSKRETPEDYFPRIESARDSLGNIWVPATRGKIIFTGAILRPGDAVEYVITASDPLGESLRFAYALGTDLPTTWTDDSSHTVRVLAEHVRARFVVSLYVASLREHHASMYYDDSVEFIYAVLPVK